MNEHRIRLNAAWTSQAESDAESGRPPRIQLPYACTSPAVPGAAALHRRFHRPTGLEDVSRVDLVLIVRECFARVRLNSTQLQPNAETATADGVEFRFSVATLLQAFNELTVTLAANEALSGTPCLHAAWIEIHDANAG